MPDDRLSQRMASLARDLQSEDSLDETLAHIVESSVELVDGCEVAGITLAQRNGEVTTSFATDVVHRKLDLLQQELGEGPCADAVWNEEVVSVRDLADEPRWPRWRPRAVQDFGMRSLLCLRLFTHEDRVGALNLFSTHADAFDADAVEEAMALAAHASVAFAASKSIEDLTVGLDTRTVIGQATGLIMAMYKLSPEQAFSLLTRLSNEQNRKIVAIARDLVTTWGAEAE